MRKVTIISDGRFASDEATIKDVLDQFSFVKELDADVQLVTDKLYRILPEGSNYTTPDHRIEFEGPTVFDYEPEFLESLKDSEVIIAHYSAVNKKMMDAIPGLKMIGIMRSGTENVEMDAAKEKGIIVCNSPGRVSEPVADYTVSLILAFHRCITKKDMVITKDFNRTFPKNPKLIKDMTIGLVGFGIIGRKVAQRLSGFGCRLLAYDPFINKEAAEKMGVEAVSLEQLLKESDCVTMHARYMEETKDMIGKEQFAMMKPDAFIVNTARSRLINEEAMLEALQNHQIRGAALDVYDEEPLPLDSKFFELDNVILSPHIAGTAGDWTRLTIAAMQEEVERYLKGEALKFQVNK